MGYQINIRQKDKFWYINTPACGIYVNDKLLIDETGKPNTAPIGTIFITKSDNHPGEQFGGDWQSLATNITLPLGGSAPIIFKADEPTGTLLRNRYTNDTYKSMGTLIGDATGHIQANVSGYPQLSVDNSSQLTANLSESTNAITKLNVWQRVN